MKLYILGFYSLLQHCDYFTLMSYRKIIYASVFGKAVTCTDIEKMYILLYFCTLNVLSRGHEDCDALALPCWIQVSNETGR